MFILFWKQHLSHLLPPNNKTVNFQVEVESLPFCAYTGIVPKKGNLMTGYIQDFVRYNRTNQYGITLAIIAISFDVLFFALIVATFYAGGSVSFGWWAMFPIVFTVLATAHLIARPLVARKFNN